MGRRHESLPFEPGDYVEIIGTGYTGQVLVSDKSRDQYLVDPYPGALGGYCWVAVGTEMYAANWFKAKKLKLKNIMDKDFTPEGIRKERLRQLKTLKLLLKEES